MLVGYYVSLQDVTHVACNHASKLHINGLRSRCASDNVDYCRLLLSTGDRPRTPRRRQRKAPAPGAKLP